MMIRKLTLMMLVCLFSTSVSYAFSPKGTVTMGPGIGWQQFNSGRNIKCGPVYTLDLGYYFTDHISADVLLGFYKTKFKDTSAHSDGHTVQLSGTYSFSPLWNDWVPRLYAGIGNISMPYQTSKKERAFAMHLGGGVDYMVAEKLAVRFDLRGNRAKVKQSHKLELLPRIAFVLHFK